MHNTYQLSKASLRALALGLILMLSLAADAQAQVTLRVQPDQITIQNAFFPPAAMSKASRPALPSGRVMAAHMAEAPTVVAKKTKEGRWVVQDQTGTSYPAGGYQTGGTGEEEGDGEVIVVGGYQDGGGTGSGDPGSDDPPEEPGGGYQAALQFLEEHYGAVIEHDVTLQVDIIALPDFDDPIATFFNAVVTDSLDGQLLIAHFSLVEIASHGAFGLPQHEPAVPQGTVHSFPSDVYYPNQWNLSETGLAHAAWASAAPQQRVRVALIDSGIGAGQQGHAGLDGAAFHHEPIAPTTGFPADHALGLATLLADANDDGAGVTSLLGAWASDGCYAGPALTTTMTPEIYSYNVGDLGPSSVYVARAIRRSIEQNVDIINLSLRLAYSPTVEAAIQEALDANIIVVAAAGNYAPTASSKPTSFPAHLPGVIAVGGATRTHDFTSTSATDGVDILAPGEEIIVGGGGGVWYEAVGTSYAAPHVAAALALLRTVQPGLTPAQALAALQQGALHHGAGNVPFLDVPGAFNQILPPEAQIDWNTVPEPHACSSGSSKRSTAALLADAAPSLPLGEAQPQTLALDGNFPNPFNPTTTISFQVPVRQVVRVAVYNALGQQVQVLADGSFEAGRHEVRFEAQGLPSGPYFTRLEADGRVLTRSMVLMK